MRLHFILTAVAFMAAGVLSAQTFRGAIAGSVTDSTGAALGGAEVTATNVGTALTRKALTDASGDYALTELPPGGYTVTAGLTGFKTATVKGVRVEVSATARVNLQLALGEKAESVEVTAGLPLVDATHNV